MEDAVTKFWQAEETLRKMTESALGKKTEQFQVMKLSGGFCSAVYLIQTDGQKMVLKIAAKDTVKMMRHERDYVPIEAVMLKALNEKLDISMPKLIFYDDSCRICTVPYFFMSCLEGEPLISLRDLPEAERGEIKRQIGVITRKICSIQAPCFGIPAMPETYENHNSVFVSRLFEMLLQDAAEKEISIPGTTPEELLTRIAGMKEILDEADSPCYAHTDTWDGNVMVKDGKFSGLVDYAAILYGDPLISHDFHDFAPEPRKEFLEGYGKTSFTENEKARILVYRVWQRLGMVVERGYREYENKNLYDWVLGEFEEEVKKLKRVSP